MGGYITGRIWYYENTGSTADGTPALAVRLIGTLSNREGVGAVAFATVVEPDTEPPEELFTVGKTQRRTRTIGSGYLAQSSAWLRFAFGSARSF